jgi:geranylgeranyl transferase type-2 subunit alpha
MSHGIKRQRESPEKEAARLEKERSQISEYRALVEDVMLRVYSSFILVLILQRSRDDFSKSAFDLTTTLLKKNPEFYTVWNYRRQILLKSLFNEYVVVHDYF